MGAYYRRRGLVGPAVLITLGAILLADRLLPGEYGFHRLWPLLLIVIGVVRLLEMSMRRDEPLYPPPPTPAPGPPPQAPPPTFTQGNPPPGSSQ
jgi:hypothetical protein